MIETARIEGFQDSTDRALAIERLNSEVKRVQLLQELFFSPKAEALHEYYWSKELSPYVDKRGGPQSERLLEAIKKVIHATDEAEMSIPKGARGRDRSEARGITAGEIHAAREKVTQAIEEFVLFVSQEQKLLKIVEKQPVWSKIIEQLEQS